LHRSARCTRARTRPCGRCVGDRPRHTCMDDHIGAFGRTRQGPQPDAACAAPRARVRLD
jgi:hypothetical protein